MPRIFIDTERLRDPYSGLGQFCLHLGHEIVQQNPDPDQYKLIFGVPKAEVGVFGDAVQYHVVLWSDRLWRSAEYDVWHATHQDANRLPASTSRFVLTIHDLNFLERADYSAVKKANRLAALQRKIDRAATITTISEYTASVVRQHLNVGANKPLRVIHNGSTLTPDAPQERPAFVPEASPPFFLYLGVIHPKKNVQVLLPLLQAFPDYRLILAGNNTHDYALHVRQQAIKLGVSEQLLMPGIVSDAEKAWLYAHCEAFLFPSLSEGFGLPVVEAMQMGKPVFLSNSTSLPEVGGIDAFYFDSFEPDDMVNTFREGMIAYHEDPLRADRLRWYARRFTWQKAAKAYWEVYGEMSSL
jgi:glycosyltransferase involved in cell wall biosynthesis